MRDGCSEAVSSMQLRADRGGSGTGIHEAAKLPGRSRPRHDMMALYLKRFVMNAYRVKRAVVVLAAAVAAVMLGGCHGKIEKSSFSVPKSFDTDKKYTITFWAKNDTNKTQVAIYNKAVEDFEALYPNIEVKLRLYTNYGDIYNDVITNISTGTTPNVCITYPDNIATYMSGENVVVELDDLASDSRYGLGGNELAFDSPSQKEVTSKFLEECRIDGHLMAIPFMRSTEACYINKTFVEKLGYEVPDVLTWDYIWEVSEAAMEKDEDGLFRLNGQKTLIPFLYKSTDNMLIQMLKQYGGGYSTDAGEVLLFNDTTRELLKEIAVHAESRAFSTFKISSYPANFLNAGQCLFAVDSTAGSTWMGSDAPLVDISPDKIVKFETAVRPVPQADAAEPKMISQGPSVCIFNKEDPQEVLASWLFAQYLLTNEVQISYSSTEGYLPVTSKAIESGEYQEYLAAGGSDNKSHYSVKIDAVRLIMDHTDDTFVTPVFNGSASLRDAASYLVEDTAKNARRGQSIDDEYFSELFKDVRNLYHLDQIEVKDDAGAAAPRDLGPLPVTSRVLLIALAAAWAGILLWTLKNYLAKRRREKV